MEFSKAELKNFRQAFSASLYSSYPKQHIGAVVVYKNRPLSVGWNIDRELSLQKRYNRYRGFDVNKYQNYGHAEMCALHKLDSLYNLNELDKNKLSIYVWRGGEETKKLARPCAACEKALKDFGIKNVYYTGDNSLIYEHLE